MTSGTVNLANSGGGQITAGALPMQSAGAAVNVGGDALRMRLEARYDAVADVTQLVLAPEEMASVDIFIFREAGILHLSVAGPSGLEATIETSADLINWSSVETVTLVAEPLIWSDPDPAHATDSRRFYRGRFDP